MITTEPPAKVKDRATSTRDYGQSSQEAFQFTYLKIDPVNNNKMCFYVEFSFSFTAVREEAAGRDFLIKNLCWGNLRFHTCHLLLSVCGWFPVHPTAGEVNAVTGQILRSLNCAVAVLGEERKAMEERPRFQKGELKESTLALCRGSARELVIRGEQN